MSKIGDLFVKLGLKSQDFNKGMKDAKKETSNFANAMSKIKGVAVAAWAAIGAAAVKMGKDLIRQTQAIGDKWAEAMAGMKAGYQVFLGTLATGEGWNNLFSNIREAVRLAREAQRELDEVFERKISFSYEVAETNKQIAEQQKIMRDRTKSNEERIAAAKEIIRLEQELGNKKREIWQQEANANRKNLQAVTNLNDQQIDFLVKNYNANRESLSAARDYAARKAELDAQIEMYQKTLNENYSPLAAEAQTKAKEERAALVNSTSQAIKDLVPLVTAYDKANDTLVKNMADAEVAVLQIDADVINATMRAENMLASLQAEIAGSKTTIPTNPAEKPKYARNGSLLDGITAGVGLGSASVTTQETNLLEAWNKRQQEIMASNAEAWQEWVRDVEEAVNAFRGAVVSGFSDGVQEMAEQLAGLQDTNAGAILQKMLTPLADLATKEGEIILASGLGLKALREELAAAGATGGVAAIAAGATLIAIGAAAKAGLSSLAAGGSSAGANYNGSGTSITNAIENMEMTIYVKGKISGRDIVISGERTTNYYSR